MFPKSKVLRKVSDLLVIKGFKPYGSVNGNPNLPFVNLWYADYKALRDKTGRAVVNIYATQCQSAINRKGSHNCIKFKTRLNDRCHHSNSQYLFLTV
jgi:hypothetical protein